MTIKLIKEIEVESLDDVKAFLKSLEEEFRLIEKDISRDVLTYFDSVVLNDTTYTSKKFEEWWQDMYEMAIKGRLV